MGLRKLISLLTGQGEAAVDKANAALASFDPETAVKVDRKELEENFRTIAIQLANAEEKLRAEEADVVNVNNEIERNIKAAEVLLSQGKEEPANKLLNEVERLKNKLVHEAKERDAALQIVTNFKAAHAKLNSRLENYDAQAKEVIATLNEAKSEKAAAAAIRKSEELVSSSTSDTSAENSLALLGKKASTLRAEARVDETMTNLGRSVAEKDADVAAALAVVDAGSKPNETVSERLARLKAK